MLSLLSFIQVKVDVFRGKLRPLLIPSQLYSTLLMLTPFSPQLNYSTQLSS